MVFFFFYLKAKRLNNLEMGSPLSVQMLPLPTHKKPRFSSITTTIGATLPTLPGFKSNTTN